ncbi:hypothetical protein OG943_03895 [Amycolatopsis sp. NBC_00345]|uniref:hypothetical protein n=1 Tax=Amycolatopsis sp. NBC_00345 TaxID=2975955 RepID=UPI002E253F55
MVESVADEYLERLSRRAAALPAGNPHAEQSRGPAFREEIFGPVAPVVVVRDEFTQWQWLTVREQAHGFPF